MREILVWEDLDKMAVSLVFNRLCEESQITKIKDLVEITGFSAGYISTLKNGKNLPSKKDLEAIVAVISGGSVAFAGFLAEILAEQERREAGHELLSSAKKKPIPCLIPMPSPN